MHFEAEDIMAKLDKLSNGQIHFRDDMERIISHSIEKNKLAQLEELSFHAKFSNGLLKIIQRKESVIDDKYFLKVTEEYRTSILKVKELSESIIEDAGEFIKSVFIEKYFQLTQQSLKNLNQFCSDLSFLKFFFNDTKIKNLK